LKIPHGHIAENKRVVLITGNSSKWYEQAIFVIKKDIGAKQLPVDFVKEAENIIENYMKSLEGEEKPHMFPLTQTMHEPIFEKKHSKKGFSWIITLSMVVASAVILFITSTRFWL